MNELLNIVETMAERMNDNMWYGIEESLNELAAAIKSGKVSYHDAVNRYNEIMGIDEQ